MAAVYVDEQRMSIADFKHKKHEWGFTLGVDVNKRRARFEVRGL
jgi:hypothetical protein